MDSLLPVKILSSILIIFMSINLPSWTCEPLHAALFQRQGFSLLELPPEIASISISNVQLEANHLGGWKVAIFHEWSCRSMNSSHPATPISLSPQWSQLQVPPVYPLLPHALAQQDHAAVHLLHRGAQHLPIDLQFHLLALSKSDHGPFWVALQVGSYPGRQWLKLCGTCPQVTGCAVQRSTLVGENQESVVVDTLWRFANCTWHQL